MEICKKEDRVVIMKNELYYYCKNGWTKSEQLMKHLGMMQRDEDNLLTEDDVRYIFDNSEEIGKLIRERDCVSGLLDYFLK